MALIINDKVPTIPEFFKNKNIFMTGGSGFIGKVLIEKLLRSCPEIGNIYVLLREKKTKTPQERVKAMTDIPLFELLKERDVNAIKKIVPLNGDVCKLGLGLNDEDRNTIVNRVNIIIHIAASVRFDDPLKKAIINNVRSTAEIVKLAKDLRDLAVFVHVSTAYCNSDKKIIEEKFYPAHIDWRDAILLAESGDEHALDIFSQKFINPLPNTYTFTKALAEHVVNDLCGETIPALILRPSIVISSLKEPMQAWIENFNGPYGFAPASAMGALRILYLDREKYVDQVFVDNVAKSLIVATWEKYVSREKRSKISIYNCCSDVIFPLSVFSTVPPNIFKELPLEKKIWAPAVGLPGYLTNCYYQYFINVILFHMIPAVLFDGILKLFGKKAFLASLQRRVYIANMAILYFMTNSWEFKRENYVNLEDKLLQEDVREFSFVLQDDYNTYENQYKLIKDVLRGIKMYLLNESPRVSERTILIDRSFRIVDKIVKSVFIGLMLYVVFWKYDIVTLLLKTIYNHFSTTDLTSLNL